jgi:hypothetical protein
MHEDSRVDGGGVMRDVDPTETQSIYERPRTNMVLVSLAQMRAAAHCALREVVEGAAKTHRHPYPSGPLGVQNDQNLWF